MMAAGSTFTRRIGRRRRGFTLVELVIVGALIALFAGLAVFSIQQQFRNNQKKAMIAEARNIGAALDLSHMDVGIFPKLTFMEESEPGLRFVGSEIFGPTDQLRIFNHMDIYGRDTSGIAFPISSGWKGPYFALSQSRRGFGQGSGGFVYMQLEDDMVGSSAESRTRRWAADAYGNPWTVYMLDIIQQPNGTSELRFVSARGPEGQRATTLGNYVNAVVSYGYNQVPGGSEEIAQRADLLTDARAGLRLYSGRIGSPTEPFIILEPEVFSNGNDLTHRRAANAWSAQFFVNAGFPDTLLTDPAGNTPIGITDTGSDDIVFEF
jgi:prepilin-type N-terminal cleavage/methylation domain-containing protein